MAKIRQMIDQECRRGLFVETYTVTLLAVRCPHHDEWRVMRGEYREYLARVFGPKQRDGIHAPFQQGAQDHGLLCAVDRKSVVSGKSVSVRVDLGGRRSINKKKIQKNKK